MKMLMFITGIFSIFFLIPTASAHSRQIWNYQPMIVEYCETGETIPYRMNSYADHNRFIGGLRKVSSSVCGSLEGAYLYLPTNVRGFIPSSIVSTKQHSPYFAQ